MAALPSLPSLPKDGHSRPGTTTARRHSQSRSTPPGYDSRSIFPVAAELRAIFEKGSGSALRAWHKHFDKDNDHRISRYEFRTGMKEMNFGGDADALFALLDSDKSGELTLEEIDGVQAALWRNFRGWCARTYLSVEDLFLRMGGRQAVSTQKLTRSTFVQGLMRAGWSGGWEDLLFHAFDVQSQGYLSAEHMRWLEIEQRRLRRKESAKQRAVQARRRMSAHVKKAPTALVLEFKAYLKRRFGGFVRAWRQGLSPDGAMVLHRTSFFKSCVRVGWICDTKQLWEAFDKDESGFISLDELDLRSSEVLARFAVFVQDCFGGAAEAFKALDRYGTRRMRQPAFEESLRACGYRHSVKMLFHGLDWDGKKSIVQDDLVFLDRWRPAPFLLAAPSEQAREEIKAKLLEQYKSYLKAWRRLLDKDSSNRCNWFEFEAASHSLGFVGDVAGAWRSLDSDFSGYITLREIDAASSDTLSGFKTWADEEFGGVASLFSVFDYDGSNEITYHEFRRCCRIYGFEGNAHQVFWALDAERSGTVSASEMGFLDSWDFPQDTPAESPPATSGSPRERPPTAGVREEAADGREPGGREAALEARASTVASVAESRVEVRRNGLLCSTGPSDPGPQADGSQLPPLQLAPAEELPGQATAPWSARGYGEAGCDSGPGLGSPAGSKRRMALAKAWNNHLASRESLQSLWSEVSRKEAWEPAAPPTRHLRRDPSAKESLAGSAATQGRASGRGDGLMPTLDDLLHAPRLSSARRSRPLRPWPRSPCVQASERVAWPLTAR